VTLVTLVTAVTLIERSDTGLGDLNAYHSGIASRGRAAASRAAKRPGEVMRSRWHGQRVDRGALTGFRSLRNSVTCVISVVSVTVPLACRALALSLSLCRDDVTTRGRKPL